MIIRPEQRKYPLNDFLLEFKYLKLSHLGFSGENLKKLSIEELKMLAPIKEKFAESEKQLFDYQTRLQSKYGDVLKLQLISVVAVRFKEIRFFGKIGFLNLVVPQ
jgi:hypothetical protein